MKKGDVVTAKTWPEEGSKPVTGAVDWWVAGVSGTKNYVVDGVPVDPSTITVRKTLADTFRHKERLL